MRTFLTMFVFIASFFIGYQAGAMLGEADWFDSVPVTSSSSATGEVRPTVAVALPNGQRSLLLIGVDRLQSHSPRLEGIWVLSYVANSTHLYFLSIYPSITETDAKKVFPSLFSLDRSGAQVGLSADFLAALHSKVPVWSGYLLLDRKMLSEIANAIKGRDVSAPLGNLDVIKDIPHVWEDPRGALLGQAELFKEMCWDAAHSEADLDFNAVLLRLPNHFLSDMEPEVLAKELDQLEAQMTRFSCEFPTLMMSERVGGE